MNQHIAQILDNLFFGSCQSTQHQTLLKYNINKVYYITIDPEPLLENIEYESVYFNDNQQDTQKLFKNILPNLLTKIHKDLLNGQNVLVCCSAGKSRSATIIISYLMKFYQMSYQDAIEYISTKRNININPSFDKELKKIEF